MGKLPAQRDKGLNKTGLTKSEKHGIAAYLDSDILHQLHLIADNIIRQTELWNFRRAASRKRKPSGIVITMWRQRTQAFKAFYVALIFIYIVIYYWYIIYLLLYIIY